MEMEQREDVIVVLIRKHYLYSGTGEIMEKIRIKLLGHYRYYGVSHNSTMIGTFRHRTIEYLFKVLNRRSNRKSYSWEGFNEMLKYYKLPYPKIYFNLFD